MDHHGVDVSEGHVHHHASHGSPAPAPPSSSHEGHHSPEMTHHGSHGEHTKHGHHEGGGHDMSMAMFFHTGDAETILFKFWRTESAMALTLSCLLIFVVAVLYEALKFFREWLFSWDRRRLAGGRDQYNRPRRYREANYNYNQPTYPPRTNQQSGTQIYHTHHHVQENTPPAGKTTKLKVYCSGMHILQTLLHVLQVLISFLLMLVFMTFNVWLCVAVLLGAGVGYYIFCAFRTNVQEHCN
ncbi:GM12117 [Drosophila sechellia]|uniref:Copper transport protein n=1 Tax=Drosophila sechellia TaxID=7238 RepID=B4HZX5_DROSE|nr:GM12117 [Drosophila sechellia]